MLARAVRLGNQMEEAEEEELNSESFLTLLTKLTTTTTLTYTTHTNRHDYDHGHNNVNTEPTQHTTRGTQQVPLELATRISATTNSLTRLNSAPQLIFSRSSSLTKTSLN